MKATPISRRPDFALIKQTDVQAFYHLQMPRWLFFDSRFKSLPLEAKVTYTFLLNRFQLSKLNNWINDDGEVFIIYTRESLAEEIQISYRKVIDSMKALARVRLIYERRCGRGDANQIYLAKIEDLETYSAEHNSAPFVTEDIRSAETAVLEVADSPVAQDIHAETRPAEIAPLEVPTSHIKTCGNGTSRCANTTGQDLQNRHTSNTNVSNTKKSDTERQSVRCARGRDDGRTDEEIAELDDILDDSELWTFPEATAKVFESAIERLFFSEQLRIGDAVLPRKKIRAHLHALDGTKLQTAANKIAANTKQNIRNTTAYTMAVIFNSIWESESDVMHDPYLNSLRGGD
ncbi:MAG: replication initiator protein A [Oscillospiraceae bacterium]|jgi:hypothetical protein|nr:replication initiator protein A [Oscillospiraceae bacterium]